MSHDEDLRQRLDTVERSRRRWKTTALVSLAALAVLLLLGSGLTGFAVLSARHAEQELARALEAEQAARQHLEESREAAEKALREAGEAINKERQAREEARRLLYQHRISLAQHEWEEKTRGAGGRSR